jgi:thiol-disulfide isomerase/thioredoxin
MKLKKLLSIVILLFVFISNAQFSENFDAGVPGTMTQTFQIGSTGWSGTCGASLGGAICPINGGASATFYLGSYTMALTSLETPSLNLSVGAYKVSFSRILRNWDGDINNLIVQISKNGGSTWTTMKTYDQDTQFATTATISLNEFGPLTATTKVRFQAVNKWGYKLILDDISVSPVTTDDLELRTLAFEPVTVGGNIPVSGLVYNNGFNNINSFSLKYQIDGGAILNQNITGLSLAPGQSYNYSHPTLWNATPGTHTVKVWVDNMNVTDANANNNEIVKTIKVATNSVAKRPLIEKFTSSTCPPCATFNAQTFNSFFASNSNNASVMVYHMNYPGAGDPYYINDATVRSGFFGVQGVPSIYINGATASTGNAAFNAKFVAEETKLGFFNITGSHSITGTTLSGTVNVMPYLSGNYTLYIGVVEKLTINNVGTNGETSFKHVMLKMLPSSSGTILNTTADTSISTPFTINMATTFMEDINDLEVVAFIYDNDSNEAMQSRYIPNVLSTEQNSLISGIKIFPNPSTGLVSIKTNTNVNVAINDVLGKVVFTKNNIENNSNLDLSSLPKGVYLVKLSNELGTKTEKLILQ